MISTPDCLQLKLAVEEESLKAVRDGLQALAEALACGNMALVDAALGGIPTEGDVTLTVALDKASLIGLAACEA